MPVHRVYLNLPCMYVQGVPYSFTHSICTSLHYMELIYIFFFWGGLDAYEYYDGDNETEYEVNIIIIILMIIIMMIVVVIIENTSVLRLLKSGTRSHFWYINNRVALLTSQICEIIYQKCDLYILYIIINYNII